MVTINSYDLGVRASTIQFISEPGDKIRHITASKGTKSPQRYSTSKSQPKANYPHVDPRQSGRGAGGDRGHDEAGM
eukprot:5795654-Prymnesium_polylepis.1